MSVYNSCIPVYIGGMKIQAGENTHSFIQRTAEQEAIVQSEGNIRINAVAGSGKTSTLIEYAAERNKQKYILYLAYNKSVKQEAMRRFSARGLRHVSVETAHSLAFGHIVPRSRYTLKPSSYQASEIVDLFNLKTGTDPLDRYIFAAHVNRFMTYFCNSQASKVQELEYLSILGDTQAREFAEKYYAEIEHCCRQMLKKMNEGSIEIIHDFYLKKFQLGKPRMHYDIILFDEAQDASPAMLDIVLSQSAHHVLVGDQHQQIYSWRHAINSLQKSPAPEFRLSQSFRFSPEIADLAMFILSWKKLLGPFTPVKIEGKGRSDKTTLKATLARSNIGLLYEAIRYMAYQNNVRGIYFEGNFHSYTYADEGASLYDILHLYNRKHKLIRNKLIAGMKSLEELETYVRKTDDRQLGMMVEIVKEFGNEIPEILTEIKNKLVQDNERHSAEMIFSTVHRCKGMEYDWVKLADDFMEYYKYEKLVKASDRSEQSLLRLQEEINLLYVAVTRTRNMLIVPEWLEILFHKFCNHEFSVPDR